MQRAEDTTKHTTALLGLCCVLAGCVSSAGLVETLPVNFTEQLESLDTEDGVALRYAPNPEAERLKVNMGSVDLSVNRLLGGMLTELAVARFGYVEKNSKNRLRIAITYINLEERSYMGTPRLYLVEMAVVAEASDGEREARREFVRTAQADMDGHSVRSDQLYDLLLQFIVSIDDFVYEVFPSGGEAQTIMQP